MTHNKPILTERKQYKGISAAAKKAECSKTHLSYVMHGVRKPSKDLVERLAKLGITVPEYTADNN